MLTRRWRQAGVTLVELSIASLIGLIALAAIVSVYVSTSRHGNQLLQAAHLQQQLRGMLYLIGRDIRRAGFWQFDPRLDDITANPFQSTANGLRPGAYPKEAADSCLLFSYDLDRDGKVGVGRCQQRGCAANTDADNVEQLGFRLRLGNVQSRYGGRTFACDSGYWQALNDNSVEITRLHFSLNQHCKDLAQGQPRCTPTQPRLTQTAVQVELSGHLRHKPATTLTMKQWIRVRNDRLEGFAP